MTTRAIRRLVDLGGGRRLALALLLAGACRASAQVHEIGGRKQLFIDDRFVEQAEGIAWRLHPPAKQGLVMEGGNSWEDGLVTGAGTVLQDGGKLRFWYTATPASRRLIEQNQFRLCYAESSDGIHWSKPNLGLYEWQGSRANNILLDSEIENGGGVFIDPTAGPDQRYKLLARIPERSAAAPQGTAPQGSGLYLYTSPDGLRWLLHPTRVFPFSPDTVNMALYDDRSGQYLAFIRTWIGHRRRVGVVATNDILQPWPYDRSVPPTRLTHALVPGREVPEAFGADTGGASDVDYYTSAVVHYPWADDTYLMFPSLYRHFPDPPVGKQSNDGPLDIQLAVSRTGRQFHRVSSFPYIVDGLRGARDSSCMYMYVGMVRRNGQIYQYYGGYDWTHGAYHALPELRHQGGMMLVTQRLDGFVAVEADDRTGSFQTPMLTFQGRHLSLNVEASASGRVEVELRDRAGQPLPGFSFADCEPIHENDLDRRVSWRSSGATVAGLAGQPLRIAFRMQAARLYAFQFVE